MPQYHCPVCRQPALELEEVLVRQKHPSKLIQCGHCGFAWLDKPTWLAEAYASPIEASDTGYVTRNLALSRVTSALILGFLDPSSIYLDYGGGCGLFVRLMRDRGIDFRWQDAYAANLFARGFEWEKGQKVQLATAFEVFEHLVDPFEVVANLSHLTDAILFSTELLPDPAPRSDQWWYYGLSHGQHIAFHTRRSLQHMAETQHMHLLTDSHSLHIFHKGALPRHTIRSIKSKWFAAFQAWIRRRPSLMVADNVACLRKA